MQEAHGGYSRSLAAFVTVLVAVRCCNPRAYGSMDKSLQVLCHPRVCLVQRLTRVYGRGGILDRLFMDRVEILSTFQTVAYSPVTGRRTIAHKTGTPSLDGPLLTVSEPTPLEEYYKEQAEDRIKHICMDVKEQVAIAESESLCQSPPGTSFPLLYSNALTSSSTSDVSSINWSHTTSARSNHSSLVPGIGYLSAKALQWIGEGTLDTVTHAIIWKRTNHHLSCLKRWQKKRCKELDHSTRTKIFNMVSDALDLSE